MSSNFVAYLRKIIKAPVMIKNIDGYIYKITGTYSILSERTAHGTVADDIIYRLKRCSKIAAVGSWNMNELYVKFIGG